MLKPLKSTAKSILSMAGLLSNASPTPYIQCLLGEETMVAADVGAAGWLPPHWENLEGGLHFLFFEPHPGSYQKLVQRVQQSAHPSMISVMQTALSGSGGARTLHLLNTPTGSSLLPVNMDSEFVDREDKYIFPITETEVDTRSLGDVLQEQKSNLHMLKLDVQGAELEILEGMGEARRQDLVMVESEVNMAHGGGHLGCPQFNDLKEILNATDMRLYDVRTVHTYRKNHGYKFWFHENVFGVYHNSPSISGRIWEFDVMYFKDYRTLMNRQDIPQLRRLLVALCAYWHFSEAHFIVEKCQQEGLFDSDTANALLDAILQWHNKCAKQVWYATGGAAKWMRAVIGAK